MAKEAYYFSHDSNARNDQKLIQVRIKLKWEGYGLYWALIEMLRDAPDYKLPANYNVIAYDLRTDNAIVKSLINDYGLFVISDDYFYSESLCDRMKMRSEKGRTAATKRWDDARALQTHSERNTDAMHSDANKGKESKVKEKKVKERKEIEIPPESEFLKYCFSIIPDDYDALLFSLKAKYQAWKENNWIDGNGHKILNWKTKILNTIPYLKKEKISAQKENKHGNTATITGPKKEFGSL